MDVDRSFHVLVDPLAGSWNEFNRIGGYLAVFVIGLSVGRHRSVRTFAVYLFLLIASAAALYALATKVTPSLVDNIENQYRVSVPIGYANGLGLFLALALPPSLYVATSSGANVVLRMLVLLMTPLILISLFFTLSRGATVALIVGLLVYFISSPARLRGFYTLLLALVPAAIIAYWSNGQPSLMETGIDLQEKLTVAASLRVYLIISLAALAFIYLWIIYAERKIDIGAKAKRITGLIIIGLVVAVTLSATSVFVASKPSFTGWVSESYQEITMPSSHIRGTGRLVTFSLTGRYQIWKESLINWKKSPLTGSGAQSFTLVHMMLREDGKDFVRDPHGLLIQFLTDLGLVGLFIGLAFIIAVMTISIKLLKKVKGVSDKGLVASLSL